jgi:ABC-type transport system involved in multi-copper enzyme maturation permease subunit
VATITTATIISGALDAMAGVVVYWIYKGLNPLQVLQYIASGIFGPSVINGSFLYVVIGLLLHFVIAFAFSYAYYLAFPLIKPFAKNTVVNGLVYGAFI